MKVKFSTIAILFIAYSSSFAICKSSDHWGKFYNGKTKNQGSLGSCHTFASNNMLEIKFRDFNYISQNFSEKDLFILNYIEESKKFLASCNGKATDDFENLKNKLKKIDSDNLWYSENKRKSKSACSAIMSDFQGGNIFRNLEIMQKHGVCSDWKDNQYDVEKIKPICNKIGSKVYQAYCRSTDIVANKSIQLLSKEMNKVSKSITQSEYLNFRSKKCAESIKRTKEIANKIDIQLFVISEKNRSDVVKREQIKKQLTDYLECGPINASVANYHLLLSGKDLPNDAAKHSSGHAVVITGYDCSKNEFLIRNSWGSKDENGNYIPERVSANDFIESSDLYTVLLGKSSGDQTACEKKLIKSNNAVIKYTKKFSD